VTPTANVAIIGAGPYGLSIGAHLRARGVPFRIFGSPMHSWLTQMPKGMLLKSEGFASNLYDPFGGFTLGRFCQERGLPYEDVGLPVPLSTMTSYGLAFQQRIVPEVDEKMVEEVDRPNGVFTLRLADGETVSASSVVVATGMSCFRYIPPVFSQLPPNLATHAADHHDLARFKDQDVAVFGGGSSALDLAAALQECGARVSLVVRRSSLSFNPRAKANRAIWQRLRYPVSGIGFGLRSRFYTDAPLLFHYLPESIRLKIVRTYLGPAGGHFVRDRIMGSVSLVLGHAPEQARILGDQVLLRLRRTDNSVCELTTSHVIAATGYRVDLRRMNFLNPAVLSQLRTADHTPILSSNFESSVPGLYFVGLSSASSFGPMMRFMFGAGYTSRRLAQHLSRRSAGSSR
jgi:hypothetical protein